MELIRYSGLSGVSSLHRSMARIVPSVQTTSRWRTLLVCDNGSQSNSRFSYLRGNQQVLGLLSGAWERKNKRMRRGKVSRVEVHPLKLFSCLDKQMSRGHRDLDAFALHDDSNEPEVGGRCWRRGTYRVTCPNMQTGIARPAVDCQIIEIRVEACKDVSLPAIFF